MKNFKAITVISYIFLIMCSCTEIPNEGASVRISGKKETKVGDKVSDSMFDARFQGTLKDPMGNYVHAYTFRMDGCEYHVVEHQSAGGISMIHSETCNGLKH